ncbi:MAG: purine-binding chemotaxis protein CheW [Blastocatellia bacterium]|nr:purine-binding chemotaxis protein CheW [Blastocatellia bacterium]
MSRQIDWNLLYKQIEEQTKLVINEEDSEEEIKNILKLRTERLAKPIKEIEIANTLSVVEFLLAKEKYAIESIYIQEIQPLLDLTTLPTAPKFILGITNLRGQILSVMNLKTFFNLSDADIKNSPKLIVVSVGEMTLAFLADDVIGESRISLLELQTSLPTLNEKQSKYLIGITKDQLIVLDIVKLLMDKKIIVNEEVE